MHSQSTGRLVAQPQVHRAGAAARRLAPEAQKNGATIVKEPKQRTALVTPPSHAVALLSRLTADSDSYSQLDPLSSLEQCPSLFYPSLVDQPPEVLTLPEPQLGSQQQLAATIYEPQPRQKKPDQDPRGEDFYANVGYAIRTLREELPVLFQEDLTCEPHLCLALSHSSCSD